MTEYFVPARGGESELVEKRSRFLGHLRPVESEEEARAFIAQMKKEHYDARHNCWCYLLKDGPERYSDDGEPQGTAGIPMLELFRREGVTNLVCVVTRYFGGVLLGTGGLLRAYTQSAKDALTAAGRAAVRAWREIELSCPYALLERVRQETAAFGGAVEGEDYGAEVTLRLLLPAERAGDYAARLYDLSAGKLAARPGAEVFRAAKTGG
ncbi:MAG: YigZ family protein [Oscillospiraceae bacterium]|nr:YigZ family protein [Oscillospiraceae bacterium]